MTFREFIEAHPSLADRLKQRPQTVRQWKTRNAIPRAHWPELLDQFPQLNTEALRKMEAMSQGG